MSECRAHLEEFVRNFYAPADSGAALLWALTPDAKASRWFDPTDPADVDAAIAAAESMSGKANLYYGICLRRRKMARYERGGEDDCVAQLAAIADLDVEGPGHKGEGLFPTIDAALEALRRLPLPPTYITHSAGGIQAGWCFREPVDPHDPLIAGIRQRLVETLRRHAGPWVNGVDSTVDAARIMRLPGTFNLKEGLKRATFLLERDWERRYDPSELDEILDPLQREPPAPKRERGPFDGDSIGRIVDESTTWEELLSSDGWQPMKWHGDERYWIRPGKDHRDGHSAVEHRDGPLSVFTTAIPSLCQPWALNRNQNSWTYGRFGYIAATRHGGDLSEAGRAARAALNNARGEPDWSQLTAPTPDLGEEDENPRRPRSSMLIDWPEFWAQDLGGEDWLAEPILPRGRQIVLYAKAKAGKSLLTLDIAAALATGRPLLGRPARAPVTVLYLDYEMTPADLQERLEDLGYGPSDDLSRLKYAQFPPIDALNTRTGAEAVVELVKETGAELVIIDTTVRAVVGEENSSDTIAAFYHHTGKALKKLGVTLLRNDHAGKDLDKGQRGSSAKVDDVDLVWYLKATDDGVELVRTHQRVSWVPQRVALTRQTEPCLAHLLAPRSWPAGTAETARLLDELGAPSGISVRKAKELLRQGGEGRRTDVVAAALRYRSEAVKWPGNTTGNTQ